MASVVQICNAALSHIGQRANVTSIDPPDGSAEAGYCAQFYPFALAAALELASWGFATFREALAEIDNPSSTWAYAYAYPSDAINLIAVLPADALDDYSQNFSTLGSQNPFSAGGPALPDLALSNPAENVYTPQPYTTELNAEGDQIILTNCPNAVLRFTRAVDDPNKFSPLFAMALSYMLASLLAGPILKGDAGAKMAEAMLKRAGMFEAQAEASDANQRRIVVEQRVSWMAGR
jgi:hypothetical protein